MHIRLPRYLFLTALFSYTCEANIPDFIHPCDTVDSACLTKSAQEAVPFFVKGIPEYGIPILDPFISDVVKMDLTGISFTFINGRATGLRKCQVKEMRIIPKEEIFIFEARCNLTLTGPYKARGRLLLFEIDGDGDAKIKLNNLGIKINVKFTQEKDAQGVEHFVQQNYKYEPDFGGRVTFALTNLFKNNPELSKTIVAFMNDNWKLLIEEFGKPIIDYCVDITMKNVGKFYASVNARELYGPSIAWPLSAN